MNYSQMQRTWLGFIHGSIRIGLCACMQMGLFLAVLSGVLGVQCLLFLLFLLLLILILMLLLLAGLVAAKAQGGAGARALERAGRLVDGDGHCSGRGW